MNEISPIKKQVSLYFPIQDKKLMQAEALRRGIPITDLVRGWIEPKLEKLRKKDATR